MHWLSVGTRSMSLSCQGSWVNPCGAQDCLSVHLPHVCCHSRNTWKRRGWRGGEWSFSAVLCQSKETECIPHLFNVFLMFLAQRLFFDMLSLPTGANAARASWLVGCRLAHMCVPSFLCSLVYLQHLPGLLRNLHTGEVSNSNKTKHGGNCTFFMSV